MSTQEERIRNLQSTVLFNELTYDEMVDVLKMFKEEEHQAGEMLFDANSFGDRVFVIEKGVIRISRVTMFGDETTLDILGNG
jgi:CRP-like cAMP-binding protein